LRPGQLRHHVKGAGIAVAGRQVKGVGIHRFRVFPLAGHQLLEAVVGSCGLVDLALGVGQAVGHPGLVGAQVANLAKQGHYLRPVLALGGGVGLLVQVVQFHALAQPGEFLLAGGGQAGEKCLGLLRVLRAIQAHQATHGTAIVRLQAPGLQQQGFGLDIVVFGASDTGQADQRVGIARLGLAGLGKCVARRRQVVLLQGLVTLAEQHAVAAGVHQVLPLADIGGVLLLGACRGEVGVGFGIAALAELGHAQGTVEGRVVGVLLEGAAQLHLGCRRVARLIDHLFALGPGGPRRVIEQLLLLFQVLIGLGDQWRVRVAVDKTLPGLRRAAVHRQGAEVGELTLGCLVAGDRVFGQLLQDDQGFWRPVFAKQQVGQGLTQAGIARVLLVEGTQLLDNLRPLALDIAANTQVFQCRGEIRRGIAKQALEDRGGLFRAAGSGKQARLLQVFLALRVLQLHQALGLTQCRRIRGDTLQLGQALLGQLGIFLQQGLAYGRHQRLRVVG